MRRILWLVAILGVIVVSALMLTMPRSLDVSILPDTPGDPVAGERMFYAGGCASCHAATNAATPEEKLVLSGGLALVTDFGTFHAPNISADPNHGIGAWSVLDFVNAMVRGISPGGQHYYPSFPYTSYQRMAVSDLVDLKAFMDTLPGDATLSKPHDLPFPFNVRLGMGFWKLLYLDGEPFRPDPALTEVQNRGAYLVNGPAHCGECHTPRSALGGLDRDRHLAGAPNPDGEGVIPNITPHPDGIGGWSESDIAYALESGFTPDFDSFGGTMAKVIDNTSRLPPEDRAAIAAYLKTVSPLPRSH